MGNFGNRISQVGNQVGQITSQVMGKCGTSNKGAGKGKGKPPPPSKGKSKGKGGVAPKAEWCTYYSGQKGCSRGDQCKFAHSDGRNGTRCSFFKGPGSCKDDSRCPFLHSQSAAS